MCYTLSYGISTFSRPRVSSPDGTLSPEVPEHHGRTLSTYLRQMIRSIHDPNPLPRLSISTRGNGPRLDSVGEEESLSPSDSFSGEISSSTTRKRKWIKRWRTVDDRTISMGDIASKVSTSDDEFLSKSASTTQYATLKVTKEVVSQGGVLYVRNLFFFLRNPHTLPILLQVVKDPCKSFPHYVKTTHPLLSHPLLSHPHQTNISPPVAHPCLRPFLRPQAPSPLHQTFKERRPVESANFFPRPKCMCRKKAKLASQ